MPQVEQLINGFAARGVMLPKAPEMLVRHFREFIVAVDEDDEVLGCAALRVYTAQMAEVISLAVDESAQGLGIGRKLMDRLETEAERLNIGTLFALTLKDDFFHRLGFRTVPKELFPLKVWSDCRVCSKRDDCIEIAVAKEL